MSPVEWFEERIGDADRQRALARLSELTGSGHVFLPEFEERAELVAQARTHSELDAAFVGLPEQSPPDNRRDNLKIAGTALSTFGVMIIAGFSGTPWLFLLALFIPLAVWLSGRGPAGFYRED